MYESKMIQLINQIAHFLRREKQYKAAQRVFQALRDFQPEHAYPQMGLGMVRAEQGRFIEAQFLFQQVLSRQPGHSYATACLGLALLHRDHHGWREQLALATQSNDGLGGKEMAKQILTIIESRKMKLVATIKKTSLEGLQRSGMKIRAAS